MNDGINDLDLNSYAGVCLHSVLKGAKKRIGRFPTRMLRYFLTFRYLMKEYDRRQRPLRIVEIGIDRGQMMAYMSAALRFHHLYRAQVVKSWSGLDIDLTRCREPGYTQFIEADVQSDPLPADGDVYLLLHVIEHLHDPEKTVGRLAQSIPEQALVVIGVPCHLHLGLRLWESVIRANPNDNGHVSALSRRRVTNMLLRHHLKQEQEDGAYFFRASGVFLENHRWWQAANLKFGRIFPGWPGEYYCCARNQKARSQQLSSQS